MSWSPKSTAPPYFSLADAAISLITGDPDWGWLVDWLTLVPNTGVETAAFCAEGPIFAEPLVVTDFIPTSNPLDPRKAVQTAALMYRISAAARDRVFAAYCEGPPPSPTAGWCPSEFVTVPGTQALGADGAYATWVAPTGNTSVHVRLLSRVGTGLDARVDDGYSFPPWVGRSTVGGYNDASGQPSSWSTWTLAGGEALRFLRYAGGDHVYEIQPNACRASTYDPTLQEQPDGVTSPLRTVDPSLGGIAAELERLEFKLDTLWPVVQAVAGSTLDLGTPPEEPVELVVDEPVDVGDAIGAVISASGIPDQLDIGFGVPQRVARLGWINLGTADAWYPSFPFTHTPMVIRPFPAGTTRVSITGLPPGVSAAIAMILPAK